MPEKELKVGDVVRLKSGGPRMTVYEIEDEEDMNYMIYCRWFLENKHQPETAGFEADALEHAEPGGSFS